MRTIILSFLILAALSSHPARPTFGSSGTQSADSAPTEMLVGMEQILNVPLTTVNGAPYGQLSGLMVEPASGGIAFAVVARGGYLGIGEDRILIPWRELALDLYGDRAGKSGHGEEIVQDKAWNEPSRMQDKELTIQIPVEEGKQPEGLIAIEKFMHRKVANLEGEGVGEITSFIIEPRGGYVVLALVRTGGVLGMRRETVALPWQSFFFDWEKGTLQTQISMEKLKTAPMISDIRAISLEETKHIYAHLGYDYSVYEK
ncbi:MAG: PRC-barrel domain-containing protein [Desulfovibrionales bacterium]